uniref:SCP domain-containing protein n=1 Tax=Strongyloides papillosus TaxID=174720 RepID=A0A0N5B785_STREA
MSNSIFSALLLSILIGVSSLSYAQSHSAPANDEFSKSINEKIWKGFNYESDSKSGFKDMKDRVDIERKTYAEHLANKVGHMVHDPTNQQSKQGENLSQTSPNLAHISAKIWYDEVKDYNFNNQGFGHSTGHFTQLVWKGSSKVGCGVAASSIGVFTVCKYSPPGNVMGAFKENVSPKKA